MISLLVGTVQVNCGLTPLKPGAETNLLSFLINWFRYFIIPMGSLLTSTLQSVTPDGTREEKWDTPENLSDNNFFQKYLMKIGFHYLSI